MSWREYNDMIQALREAFDLSQDEARERYAELAEDLGHAPSRDDLGIPEIYDDYDEWEDAYDAGEFDDYPYEEVDGGIDTGGAE